MELLHSMGNSSLNFYKFTLTNGTAFSEIYKHKGNLARYIQMFGNLLPGIIVLKSNFSLNGSLCGFRIFSAFSGKRSQEISALFVPISTIEIFGFEVGLKTLLVLEIPNNEAHQV